jgi:hypothetical protein
MDQSSHEVSIYNNSFEVVKIGENHILECASGLPSMVDK